MNRRLSIAVLMVFLALSAFTLAGCDDNPEHFQKSGQKALSPLGSEARTVLRFVLSKFNGGGLQNVDLFGMADLIAAEARRYFVETYTPGETVVLDRTLDLTSGAVLPEFDMYGHFDPNGGFEEFVEETHNAAGELTGQKVVHKAAREFTKGSIEGYTYFNTVDSADVDSVRESVTEAFTVASDLEYVATIWHQQVDATSTQEGFGEVLTFGESFGYQSHPRMKFSLSAGDTYDVQHRVWDSIEGILGWDQSMKDEFDYSLHGHLTLYAPVVDGVAENKDPESDPDMDVEDLGSRTKTTNRATTVVENDEMVTGYLVAHNRITTTTITVTVTDDTTGDVLSQQATEHESHVVVYEVAPGMEVEANQARWFETYIDYVETTKTSETSDFTYSGTNGQDSTEEYALEVLRYTDNPRTRNNLWQWRSTRHEMVIYQSVDDGTGQVTTRVEDAGEQWLTDRYEADEDYDNVGFAFEGSFSDVTDVVNRFFGDDSSGVKTTVTETHNRNYKVQFGAPGLEVSGSYRTNGSTINNGDGSVHANGNDMDGTLNVTTSDGTFDVSAEEWVNDIEP